MSENKELVFIQGEVCCKCGGPILAEPYMLTEFVKELANYVSRSYWPCYACGLGQVLDGSEPYYTF